MHPWTNKMFQHPAISVPIGVFKSVDVEILRDRPDLGIEQGMIMQIEMTPNGHVGLGTFKNGNGLQYAKVADRLGKNIDVQEGLDFRII